MARWARRRRLRLTAPRASWIATARRPGRCTHRSPELPQKPPPRPVSRPRPGARRETIAGAGRRVRGAAPSPTRLTPGRLLTERCMSRTPPVNPRLARAWPALAVVGALACSAPERSYGGEPPAPDGRLFTRLPSSYTGVRFENRLTDTRELNVFTYRNFYNGGGVALGDLTGDGLPELMLTSNLEGGRLYLNQGEFRFRDVTRDAGVGGKGFWATGVTFADVNGDGKLDIYVCFAGDVAGERRANELYINQGLNAKGVPTFTETAAAYGIADE